LGDNQQQQQQQATHQAFAAPVVLNGIPMPICAPIYCAHKEGGGRGV
jgi:hypothetical protein